MRKCYFVTFVVSLIILLVLVITSYFVDDNILELTINLCLIIFTVLTFLTIMFCINDLYNCKFTDTDIIVRWGVLTYKRVPYTRIEGITIKGAVRQYKAPIKTGKKQRAVVVFFDSPFSFMAGMTSKSVWVIPTYLESLCYCFLDIEKLRVLLENTKKNIFITEQMLNLYQEQLKSITNDFGDRFIVAYYDIKDSRERKIPYKNFIDINLKH